MKGFFNFDIDLRYTHYLERVPKGCDKIKEPYQVNAHLAGGAAGAGLRVQVALVPRAAGAVGPGTLGRGVVTRAAPGPGQQPIRCEHSIT